MLSTFMKLPFVIKVFVLSILEWPFYTGFTVHASLKRLCRHQGGGGLDLNFGWSLIQHLYLVCQESHAQSLLNNTINDKISFDGF